MSFEGIKNKTRELGEVLNNKYLLMCLVALASISKDNADFYSKNHITHLNEKHVLNKQTDANTTDNSRVESSEGNFDWQEKTSSLNKENKDNEIGGPATSYPSEEPSDSTQFEILKWKGMKPVEILNNNSDSMVNSETGLNLKLERTSNPVTDLTVALRNFSEKYIEKCGYFDRKSAEGFINAINNTEQDFEKKLKNFSEIYNESFGNLDLKMKAYIASEISKGKINLEEEQVEDFIFLTCFLDHLQQDGTFAESLSTLEVDETLKKHLDKYEASNLDPEMARFSYFSHFLYKTWGKMAENPGYIRVPTQEEIDKHKFKDLLKGSVPLSLILEISKKYRK